MAKQKGDEDYDPERAQAAYEAGQAHGSQGGMHLTAG